VPELTVFDLIRWSPLHLLIPLVAAQRIWELRLAARNERRLREKGAVEVGRDHYGAIVTVHTLWFVGMIFEIVWLSRPINPFWYALLAVFLAAQGLRYWTIRSLGDRWNTRILIVPGAKAIVRGPYRFLRHPNYLAVVVELLVVPLIFSAYVTAVTVTLLNFVLLRIRIRAEERGWREVGRGYEHVGSGDRGATSRR